MAMCGSVLNFPTHKNVNLFVLSTPTVVIAMKGLGLGTFQEQWSHWVKDWVNCQEMPNLKVLIGKLYYYFLSA